MFSHPRYDTNGQMLSTAYSAAGIALAGAAAVILFSSRSFTLTIFSTLTIGYVLTSVTATLVALGWTLGFLESICFAILIGVSVDFVIHLSHAYSTIPGEADRGRRTKYALIQMGPSILATAVTTILSAVIMLFTVITFFQKFALILFFTVIQASLGSFVIFLVLVDCIGPSNPTYLVDRLFGLAKDDEEKAEDREESERTTPATYASADASECTATQHGYGSAAVAAEGHVMRQEEKRECVATPEGDDEDSDMPYFISKVSPALPPKSKDKRRKTRTKSKDKRRKTRTQSDP
jgi:hypothetical protein